MNNKKRNKIDDELISRAVQSVRFRVPEAVDRRLDAALADLADKRKRLSFDFSGRRRLLWYPAAALASVVLAALFIFQPFSKTGSQPAEPITEIRTEFELKDKNIKIIWFQKKDFKLRRKTS